MGDEILRSKHAFGSSSGVDAAIQDGKIDAYDLLMLDGDTDHPKFGWVDKNGKAIILTDEKADLSEVEADVEKLESELLGLGAEVDKKVDAEVVDEKLEVINSDITGLENSHEKIKYEISNAPVGTLVKITDTEIRIMCPKDSVWEKQNVGTGGDPNSYYVTFKTYFPSDDVVGYVEHLNDQTDQEILTTFSTDEYGRKYQPTWLAVAKYDASSDTWTYYGASSSFEKYIGWNYQIDWYNADGVMVASDCIRINLSNEECHNSFEPYYINNATIESKAYTDEKIAMLVESIAVVEF